MTEEKEIKQEVIDNLKGEREVVINNCWGGFGLSMKAIKRYAELKGLEVYFYEHLRKNDGGLEFNKYIKVKNLDEKPFMFYSMKKDLGETPTELEDGDFFSTDFKRDDKILIQVIKELGNQANGSHSKLKIVKIPSEIDWEIDDYDGMETINEVHKTWR